MSAVNFDEYAAPQGGPLDLSSLPELRGGNFSVFNFTPPGPVAERWMYSIADIDFLMGPWGSGKTTSAVFKCGAVTLRFPPCRDGVIRARGVILRDNFRELYRTTLESWLNFFPKDFSGPQTFEGGQDRPFKHTIRFRTPKGRAVEMVVIGIGVGEHAIEGIFKGFEPSWVWMNEPDLLSRKVPGWAYGRLGRYPRRVDLADPNAQVPRTVWGDLNPPLISHWVHEDFVEKPRDGYRLLRQPSGLSDQAENRIGHPREEYERMAKVMAPDEVRRFVHGEFGLVGDGALVYPEFDYTMHVAKEPLEPLDIPIRVSFDAGGSPAGVIRQFTPKGQLRVLDELAADPGTGVGRFAEMFLDLLQSKYRGLPISYSFGDPSAFYGADRQAGELSFMEILAKALGIQIWPTATNEPHARQEAVAWFLRRGRDAAGVPYFQLSPTCKVLLGGFQGGFIIELNRHETSDRIRFVKNKFSHVHEALQYGAYGDRGHAGMINDAARAGRPGNVVPIRGSIQGNASFNPFDV